MLNYNKLLTFIFERERENPEHARDEGRDRGRGNERILIKVHSQPKDCTWGPMQSLKRDEGGGWGFAGSQDPKIVT